MSSSQEQLGLEEFDAGSEPEHPTHLTRDSLGHPTISSAELSSREFFCLRCFARVTQSTGGDLEYGHGRGCYHSIRPFDHSGNGGTTE